MNRDVVSVWKRIYLTNSSHEKTLNRYRLNKSLIRETSSIGSWYTNLIIFSLWWCIENECNSPGRNFWCFGERVEHMFEVWHLCKIRRGPGYRKSITWQGEFDQTSSHKNFPHILRAPSPIKPSLFPRHSFFEPSFNAADVHTWEKASRVPSTLQFLVETIDVELLLERLWWKLCWWTSRSESDSGTSL